MVVLQFFLSWLIYLKYIQIPNSYFRYHELNNILQFLGSIFYMMTEIKSNYILELSLYFLLITIDQKYQTLQMHPSYLPTTNNQEERDESTVISGKQKLNKKISSKKILHIGHRLHDYPRNLSFSSSSLATSNIKLNSMNQHQGIQTKALDYSSMNLIYFTEKYLPRGAPLEQLFQEMQMVLQRKQNQIQALRVYRDQLKFISFNNPYYTPIRLSLRSLKGKASTESLIGSQKKRLQKQIKDMKSETQSMIEYSEYLSQELKSSNKLNGDIIDIEKQQAIMIQNLQLATEHLIKALADSKKKYAAQIRQTQDDILDLRVQIKQRQDKLRDLKAKICTMYIKLHSRNSSRGKSHERNLSFSIRKSNQQNINGMKQIFIGNSLFKNYSKQLIQKVCQNQQLLRIRFFVTKQDLLFQCIYKTRNGIIHYLKNSSNKNVNEPKQDSILPQQIQQFSRQKIYSEENTQKQVILPQVIQKQDVYVKYLFSIKFFFKSKIVGVECRVKTDKGNKHLQIGNCDPYIEHELVTLVNKNLVSLGSYWHSKQMIGISLWYSDRTLNESDRSQKSLKNLSSQKKSGRYKYPKQTYQQYYT